jgi:hypothetical protein
MIGPFWVSVTQTLLHSQIMVADASAATEYGEQEGKEQPTAEGRLGNPKEVGTVCGHKA